MLQRDNAHKMLTLRILSRRCYAIVNNSKDLFTPEAPDGGSAQIYSPSGVTNGQARPVDSLSASV